MKIKAILPVYSGWENLEAVSGVASSTGEFFRLEKTLENFFTHNPDIPVTVVNDGGKTPIEIIRKFDNCYLIDDTENSWIQKSIFNSVGAPGYLWFKRLYDFASEDDFTHIIYLETDVLTRHKIAHVPRHEMSGRGMVSSQHANDFYWDYFGLDAAAIVCGNKRLSKGGIEYDAPWSGEHHNISFLHYGTGGTIFSKSFFEKTYDKLPLIKKFNDQKPDCFLQDLAITSLALVSNCSVGDWEDLCIDEESLSWLSNKDEILSKPTGNEALVHKHEFKEE
jgi:hypothetical protein